MVKDPFKHWDRVDTFCALLVNLAGGGGTPSIFVRGCEEQKILTTPSFRELQQRKLILF